MISDHWTRGNTARVVSKCIISVALMTSVLTIGLESSASAVSAISEAGTFPVNAEVLGGTTLSVNPQKVGDLLIFQIADPLAEHHGHRGALPRDRNVATRAAIRRHCERRDCRGDLVGGGHVDGSHHDHRYLLGQCRRSQSRTGE